MSELEESVKTKITRAIRAIKKATGIQRNSLNKKAYKQWWGAQGPYKQAQRHTAVTRVKATQNPKTEKSNSYESKHGIPHSWTPGYKKSKYLGMKESLEENLKPSQKAIKYLVNKEVKKNSSASGDDFQPTKRSSKLLKKLHEGGIKDLVTKDQEEKRLLKTDKPQKVLTDKERAKLKALKKLDEAKKKLYIRPSAKPDPRTKRNQKAFERAFGKNTKSFLDTLRDPPETDNKKLDEIAANVIQGLQRSQRKDGKKLSQKDDQDKKIPNSLASYRERIARGRHYARNNDGKLDEINTNTYASAADKATNEYMGGNKKRAWLADKATAKYNERKSKE